jgi:hypothetical protein
MKQRLLQRMAWLRERPGVQLVLQVLSVMLIALLVLGISASVGAFSHHQTPPYQAGSNGPATQWYFAEGSTGTNYTEYLSWANFTATAATVTITYYFDSGAPVTKTYTAPANARSGINVNTEVGSGHSVAIALSSTQPIVVERPLYFNYSGAGGVPSGSDVVGATALGTSFYFDYLDTTAQHDSYLAILNPSSSSMTVTATYTPATGGAATTVTHTVPATSRGTITVNSDGGLAAGTYWAKVVLSIPGLVERSLYQHDTATGYTGGAAVVGGIAPQTDWYFAEGHTAAINSERYVLTNPSTTTVPVTLTFYPTSGSTFANGAATQVTQVTLAPGQQALLNVNALLGTNEVDNSAWVHAPQAILAERVMSVANGGQGLTDTVGTPTPCTQYAFAEGYTGSGFAEYLILFNPGSSTATAQVSYVPSSGSATVQTYTVPAHSRVGVSVNAVMPNQSLAMLVQVTSGPSIVAERPMYFNYGGDTGASSVVGAQTC